MSRRARTISSILLAITGLALALLVTGLVIAQTAWFKNLIRARIIAVVERATGGRVEIGGFNYNWRALTAEVKPFVLHGTEAATAPPLFRADRVQIGFRTISVFEKKVDVSSLVVERPVISITVNPDGSTNIPKPKIPRFDQNVIEDLLDLKVQHVEIRNGVADYNSWRVPLEAVGEHLRMSLLYQPSGPSYRCAISAPLMRISSPKLRAPAEFALDSLVDLGRTTMQVLQMNLTSDGMKIQSSGSIANFYAPRMSFDVAASIAVRELNNFFQSPLQPSGDLWLQGHLSADGSATDRFVGKLAAHELSYAHKDVAVRDIAAASNSDITPDEIRLSDLHLSSPEGRFVGSAEIAALKHISARGRLEALTIAEVGRLAARPTGNLTGTLSGPIQLDGQITPEGFTGIAAHAAMEIMPGSTGEPVQGSLALNYDQRAGKLELGNSQFDIGSTHASLTGTLGQNLALHVISKNLNDTLPILRALGAQPPAQLPIQLQGGEARVDATIAGNLANPRISGKADAQRLRLDGRELDHVAGTFTLDRSAAVLQSVAAESGKMHLEGSARAGLREWKLEANSPITADLALKSADLQTVSAEAGFASLPASALISAAIHVSGSVESPLIAASVTADNLTAYQENFGQARADITLTPTTLELSHGETRNGSARFTLSGVYNHPSNNWKDGSLRFDVVTSGLDLARVKHVQDFEDGLGGRLDFKTAGAARVVNGRVDLTSLTGNLSVKSVALDGRAYGDVSLTASTRLPMLTVDGSVTLGGVQLRGSGQWRMEGDYLGQAHIAIPRISLETLHDLMPGKHVREDLPFDGFLEGDATISGPLNQPSLLKADVTLPTVQLNASPDARPVSGVLLQDLVLRNAQPLHIAVTRDSIDFGHAAFLAKDTTLDASGRLGLNSKSPWDLAIQGRINFSIFQLFNPDLLGSGASLVNVTVRGPVMAPQVEGRLEMQNASLYLRDFPNGIDNANGLILFDRNRATVQTLTGKSGGGDISFEPGSFVGFRGSALVYRLQAKARNVRYRSPEDISITSDGSLALVGTSENSVLSGSVAVTRAAFGPRTDVGALLATTATPVAATPNQLLQGLQLDVRVVTEHSLEVETALTRNIQADADLRVRGTPDRPVLLGRITVNSGQIEFFGNKYSINRGDIIFNNPARIEPVLNMDLSTQVRGISVDIGFSGPLNKLNFSYRSDPPLQASDIVALLAVGRTPSNAGPLAATQLTTNINNSYIGVGDGSNSLLSQAISPNSGRLQKFFGVSHIKIDPQLTDVTIVPQARLTLEQQISSDVTLTYITNLAITNQQIVRIEWDFSRKWSAVALRDENGAFSIDFQYRKRFH